MKLCQHVVTTGFLVTRHYEFMLHTQLRDPYHRLLTNETAPVKMCCQVLRNLQSYLIEEELKMMKADADCMSTFAFRHCIVILHNLVCLLKCS